MRHYVRRWRSVDGAVRRRATMASRRSASARNGVSAGAYGWCEGISGERVETSDRECQLRRTGWRGGVVAALTLVALLVAGCSASGGSGSGINYSLGLQGATNDHPAAPPQVASSGPDSEYAFVYDNQIWVRQQGIRQ